MAFYLVGRSWAYGTKMEPLLALGIAAVWAIYGGIYFTQSRSKKSGRTTLVERPMEAGVTDMPGLREWRKRIIEGGIAATPPRSLSYVGIEFAQGPIVGRVSAATTKTTWAIRA
jgi:hypothetical protein